jgi:hypothetical protein
MKTPITTLVACALLTGLLAACSSGDKEADQQGAIPEPQLQALDKARGTEKLLQDAEEKRRKQMEEQDI